MHYILLFNKPSVCFGFWQVGGVGVTDYADRKPNPEQLDNVVCKEDPRQGFSFVLNNFGMLLDDTFLQNLTEKICEGWLHICCLERFMVLCVLCYGRDFEMVILCLCFFVHRKEMSHIYLSK